MSKPARGSRPGAPPAPSGPDPLVQTLCEAFPDVSADVVALLLEAGAPSLLPPAPC